MISLLQILRYSAPVAFGGVGEAVAQKSGVINIGLEGTMLSGAYAATSVALATGNPWIGLLAGGITGLIVGILLSLFTVTLRQDQIVIGTAINLLAMGICGTLFERQGATGKLLNLPGIPKFAGGVDAMLILLVLLGMGTGFILYRTSLGLKIRAAGEYPPALEAAGFSAASMRYLALTYSGLLGGLGGAYLSLGIAQSFATDMVAGRGFVAIAMVTFARWKPIGIILSALLVGIFETLQYELQLTGIAVPKALLLMLPYVATLAILIIVGKGAKPPQSLGKPL